LWKNEGFLYASVTWPLSVAPGLTSCQLGVQEHGENQVLKTQQRRRVLMGIALASMGAAKTFEAHSYPEA